MNNKKLIEETYKFISEFNPEHFSYTDFDCDGNCQPDMKEFAETIKNFMEHICDDNTTYADKEDIDEWLKRLKDISEKEHDEIAKEIWAFALAALVHPEDFDNFPEGYDTDDNIKKAYYMDYVRTDTDMLKVCGYGKKITRNTPHLISEIDWKKYM